MVSRVERECGGRRSGVCTHARMRLPAARPRIGGALTFDAGGATRVGQPQRRARRADAAGRVTRMGGTWGPTGAPHAPRGAASAARRIASGHVESANDRTA